MLVERRSLASILRRMMADIEGAPEVTKPSALWTELNHRHIDRLLESGIENFKRTLAKDYFTWMRVLPWDSQIRYLVSRLGVSTTLEAAVGAFQKHQHIPLTESLALNFLTRLVWAYAEQQAPELSELSEPEFGNPPRIMKNGRLISQDLANSVLEFQSFAGVAKGVICELGGGYGRNAYVTCKLAPVSKYIMVDIAPALGVAQHYLTTVFPDKRHYFYRSKFSAEQFAEADFAYLLPHQLSELSEGSVDLFVNISSLHEMRMDQIRHYLDEIWRLVRPGGHFYLKAWKVSNNPGMQTVTESEYPLEQWERVHRRTPAIQTRFFETLLSKGDG